MAAGRDARDAASGTEGNDVPGVGRSIISEDWGLEFRVAAVREAGWRPIGVFATATVLNLLVALALALASVLFANFQISS